MVVNDYVFARTWLISIYTFRTGLWCQFSSKCDVPMASFWTTFHSIHPGFRWLLLWANSIHFLFTGSNVLSFMLPKEFVTLVRVIDLTPVCYKHSLTRNCACARRYWNRRRMQNAAQKFIILAAIPNMPHMKHLSGRNECGDMSCLLDNLGE